MRKSILRMNDSLVRIATYFAQSGHLVALGLTFAAFEIIILPQLLQQILFLSDGTMILDLLAWYTPDEAFQKLNVYGAAGRSLYLIAEWTADLLFPLSYGLFFSALVYRIGGGRWCLIPIYSGITDWAENILISFMLLQYPSFNPLLARIAGFLTATKWFLIFTSFLIILFFTTQFIQKFLQNRMKKT